MKEFFCEQWCHLEILANDGQTNWIVQRYEKMIFYFKINEKNKIKDLKTWKMFSLLLINHTVN